MVFSLAATRISLVTQRDFDRQASIEALKNEQFDVLVIGGGITGVGVALDAAARGLRTALVERQDFSSGTSSKSSKLVHGGLRYLQQGEIGLVYQALHERQRLTKNAPHIVEILPFLIPMFGVGGVIPAKISRLLGMAMWGYDLTGGWRIGKKHQRLTKNEALRHMPTLKEKNLVSAYTYYDATADDSRLVVAIARTAALEHGAVVLNRTTVTGLTKNSAGQLTGAEVSTGDETFTVSARAVVNASGVWSDQIRTYDEGVDPDSIRPAKGIHISVPWSKVQNDIAVVVPVRHDKRSVFVVPHGDITYIGTTDTDYDGPLDDPQCTQEDIDYLLDAINAAISEPLTHDDVLGSWAGLRPLVKSADSGKTADLSRKHTVAVSGSGMVSISGGKLTTYREMAADTIDAVLKNVLNNVLSEEERSAISRKSVTKNLPIRGAIGYGSLPETAKMYPEVSSDLRAHLGRRYGGEARVLMRWINEQPDLGEPLVPGLPYVRAEALFAVRHEMAQSVDDVLSRRTRARIYGRDDSAGVAHDVAALIAPELGWSDAEAKASAEEYLALVEHERESAELPEVLWASHATAEG